MRCPSWSTSCIGRSDFLVLGSWEFTVLILRGSTASVQLIVKMKVLGVNAVFAFDSQIQVGGSLIVGVITGTGLYLPALPPPPTLRIERNIDVSLVLYLRASAKLTFHCSN
jgi:hypothetical protein